MPATDFGLGALLAPVDPPTFFRDSWERQPLVVPRGAPDYYAGVLSLADVDRVIAFTRPKFADPAAFAATPPRAATFVQGWLADRPLPEEPRFPGIVELRRVFEQGKTVVIMTMQQRWPPVAALCRELEGLFHCPVHANMYLTPPGAQGFDAHFDTHEVFVLQLAGSKHWRLYGPARTFPSVGERTHVARDQLGAPRDVRLEAGDLLYIPRGHVHEAFTSEGTSLHLTVGVNVYRWADLLHEALDELTRHDERFRASVPPGHLGGDVVPPPLADRFRELLDVLARTARVDDALRRLGDQFFGQLPALPDAHFAPPEDAAGIDLDTVLRRRPGVICRVVRDGGWVAIEFPGGQVGGPLKIAQALHFVARAGPFPVRDLPGELGEEGKLVLARRLLRERVLTVVDRPAGPPRSAGVGK